MKINHLTTDEVIKIHDEIIEKSGGHKGIISFGNIDFTVSRMVVTKGLTQKIAVLLFGIIARHPFVDGNKRTGVVASETFLRLNNKKLIAGDKNIWIVLHKISKGDMNIHQIKHWLDKSIR